jgi:cytochrome P450
MATALLPPGPSRTVPGALLLGFQRDPIGVLMRLRREHGDVVQFRLGGERVVSITDPELIRDVLVTHHSNFRKSRGLERARRLLGDGLLTSEGEFHLRQRRLMQPAFHRRRINSYGETMVRYADRARGRWQPGATVDLHHEMMDLTLAIVGKTLFDADVEDEADEIGDALGNIIGQFNIFMLSLGEVLERLPLPSTRRFQRAKARLDDTIFRMIDERRRSGEDRGDLLSMLIAAQDTEGDGTGMSDQQVRDEALTLFLAGHETTANALTWTWYLLSQHPEIEARIHAEIDSVLEGRLPTVDDLPRLTYTRKVFSESLRLYPPAWIIGRRAINAYAVRDYTLPAGTVIIMSQYVVHRDPRWYPEPDRFDPERWTPEAQAARPKFAYFPFGGGPRLCIGEQFAWMEGVLLLATIGQQWRPRLVPGHPVELQPLITLRPKHGMRMVLERR